MAHGRMMVCSGVTASMLLVGCGGHEANKSDGVPRPSASPAPNTSAFAAPTSGTITATDLYRAYSQTLTAGRANFMIMTASEVGQDSRLRVWDGVEDLNADTAEYLQSIGGADGAWLHIGGYTYECEPSINDARTQFSFVPGRYCDKANPWTPAYMRSDGGVITAVSNLRQALPAAPDLPTSAATANRPPVKALGSASIRGVKTSGYSTEVDITVNAGYGQRVPAHVRYAMWIDAKNLVREVQIIANSTLSQEPSAPSAPPVPSLADLPSLPDIPASFPSDPMLDSDIAAMKAAAPGGIPTPDPSLPPRRFEQIQTVQFWNFGTAPPITLPPQDEIDGDTQAPSAS